MYLMALFSLIEFTSQLQTYSWVDQLNQPYGRYPLIPQLHKLFTSRYAMCFDGFVVS